MRHEFRRLALWLRGHVIIRDIVLAVFLSFASQGASSSITFNPGLLFDQPSWALTTWTVLLAVPLAIRRSAPRVGALAFAAVAALQLLFGPAVIVSDFWAPLMVYSVIAYGDPRNTKAFMLLSCGLGLASTAVMGWTMTVGPAWPAMHGTRSVFRKSLAFAPYADCDVVYAGGGLTGDCADTLGQYLLMTFTAIGVCLLSAFILAFWQRARLAAIRMMRERNAAIVAREGEERAIAATAERARIARDMHDVVAHTLSIIIVQSDGGRYAGAHDPKVARDTMETIRRESERALHDMHRLLGVFGGSQQAGYAQIGALVEQARTAAPDTAIAREVSGAPAADRLTAEAGSTVYHVVQEALTNVRKYAGSPEHVRIREQWSSRQLRIRIDDDGRGSASESDGHRPGYGLLGMRERVESVGGTLSSGPRANGGFSVDAVVPLTDATDAGETVANTTEEPSSPRFPELAVPPSFSGLWSRIRRKSTSRTGDADGRPSNWVEKASRWTQRHYLLADVSCTFLLIIMFGLSPWSIFSFDGAAESKALHLLMLMETLPLCVRRRFPESCALVVACLSVLQLLVFSGIDVSNIVVALCALYAAVLYGRDHAWRWTGATALAASLLFGCSAALIQAGYATILDFMMGRRTGSAMRMGPETITLMGVAYGTVAFLACAAVMALARWTRSRDSNMLVLQAREEALLAKESRQRVLAANLERERIGAHMQSEVAGTLNGVIEQVRLGLRMLDDAEARGVEPTAEQIAEAFRAIGNRGRAALKRMRELLGVLRETGSSDDGGKTEHPALHPAAPLSEQLRGLRQGLE